MTAWLRMLGAELPVLRDLPDPEERPLPRVEVRLGRTVPGWVLRVAAAAAVGMMLLLATHRVEMSGEVAGTVIAVAAAIMLFWPTTVMAHAALVGSGLLIGLDAQGPFDPIVFALVPLGYAAVRLAWWAERLSLTARVELSALARGLTRGCAFVGGTLVYGMGVFLIAGRPSALVVVAGGAGVALLAWLVFVARTSTRDAYRGGRASGG